MALILIATLLILGIAFYQVVQGVFSALIMTILSILSAAIAFGFYEPLAQLLYDKQPAVANGAALAALFVVSLLVLRLVFDRLIGGNVVLGVWADRIGGGVLGLISGMICVGVLATAVQMFPFGATVLTYRPFDSTLRRDQGLAPFYPDEFAIGLSDMLSGGSLAGKRTLSSVHPDLLLEAFAARNTAELYGRLDATPKDLLAAEAFAPSRNVTPWSADVPDNPLLDPTTMTTDLVVRCKVAAEVADEADKDAGFEARWALPATHFRLTCASGRSYYPVAYLTYSGGWEAQTPTTDEGVPERAKLAVGGPMSRGNKSLTVDWVYRIPQDDPPQYLTFRQTARAALKAEPPERMPPPTGALDKAPESRRRR